MSTLSILPYFPFNRIRIIKQTVLSDSEISQLIAVPISAIVLYVLYVVIWEKTGRLWSIMKKQIGLPGKLGTEEAKAHSLEALVLFIALQEKQERLSSTMQKL